MMDVYSRPLRFKDGPEAPMWAPPFPPEEYDDYDDESGLDGQEFTDGGGGGGGGGMVGAGAPANEVVGPPPYHSESPATSRMCRGGQQASADLVETLRRLFRALGQSNAEAGEQEAGEGSSAMENGAGASLSGASACADGMEGVGGREEDCKGRESGGDRDEASFDEDCELAANVLEESCLRSVCRQYMFGVDWRFVSKHRRFYRALLLFVRDALDPMTARRGLKGGSVAGEEAMPLLARCLLTASPDCPSLANLLADLCVALDDLVACPPQFPAPVPPAPTPLPPPASPALAHPPPSPASPHPSLVQLIQGVSTGPGTATSTLTSGGQHASAPPAPSAPFVAVAATQGQSLLAPSVKDGGVKLQNPKTVLPNPAPESSGSMGEESDTGASWWQTSGSSSSPGMPPSFPSVATPLSVPGAVQVPPLPVAPPLVTPTSGTPAPPIVPLDFLAISPNQPISDSQADLQQALPLLKTMVTLSQMPAPPPPAGSTVLPSLTPPAQAPASSSVAPGPSASVPPESASSSVDGTQPALGSTATVASVGSGSGLIPPNATPAATSALLTTPVAVGTEGYPSSNAKHEADKASRARLQEKETKEHEEGMELAELAREVMLRAKAIEDAAQARISVSAKRGSGMPAKISPDDSENSEMSSSDHANGCSLPADGSQDSREREHGQEVEDGAHGAPGEGAVEGDSSTVHSVVPSVEEVYLEAVEGLQFETMLMETPPPAVNGDKQEQRQQTQQQQQHQYPQEQNPQQQHPPQQQQPQLQPQPPPPPQQQQQQQQQQPQQSQQQQQLQQLQQLHHFWRDAGTEGPIPPARQRRLVRELRSLARELPLYWGSTVAVRVDEDRPHLLKAMILAPSGTPYDSGMFEFDIYCPPRYPDVPPRLNLMTTGRGTVRFNPNLYPCGNVCLSLLGTWSGSPEMMWTPDASLLQVLLSIQTFILGAQYPYFNEPGLELDFGNPGSMDRARTSPNGGYELLRPATIRWAMTEHLRNPPRGFEPLVREHLWRKKWHILGVVSRWLREAKIPGGLPGHYRDLLSSLQGFLVELIRLSHSADRVPLDPVPPGVDPERAEFSAAMRGLFGPEAGPPCEGDGSSRKRCGRGRQAHKTVEDNGLGVGLDLEDASVMASPLKAVAKAAGHESGEISSSVSEALAESKDAGDAGDAGGPGVESGGDATSNSAHGVLDSSKAGDGGKLTSAVPKAAQEVSTQGTSAEDDEAVAKGQGAAPRRTWETPEQARKRLRFRLNMVERRLDMSVGTTIGAPSRRSAIEPWIVTAVKKARSAGVGTLHGKALKIEEAVAAGEAGVTWSTHPQFRKYFMLLQLGIPRHEVVASALQNGVDPLILEHGDDEIPLSKRYVVANSCAPLLRVSPDLASKPVAQLTTASGTICAADAAEVYARLRGMDPDRETAKSGCKDTREGNEGAMEEWVATPSSSPAAETEAATCSSSSTSLPPPPSSPSSSSESHHEHPLVLSGRRIWVISPVVGWASVWAETGQNILRPEGEDEKKEGEEGNGKGGAVRAGDPPDMLKGNAGGDGKSGEMKAGSEVGSSLPLLQTAEEGGTVAITAAPAYGSNPAQAPIGEVPGLTGKIVPPAEGAKVGTGVQGGESVGSAAGSGSQGGQEGQEGGEQGGDGDGGWGDTKGDKQELGASAVGDESGTPPAPSKAKVSLFPGLGNGAVTEISLSSLLQSPVSLTASEKQNPTVSVAIAAALDGGANGEPKVPMPSVTGPPSALTSPRMSAGPVAPEPFSSSSSDLQGNNPELPEAMADEMAGDVPGPGSPGIVAESPPLTSGGKLTPQVSYGEVSAPVTAVSYSSPSSSASSYLSTAGSASGLSPGAGYKVQHTDLLPSATDSWGVGGITAPFPGVPEGGVVGASGGGGGKQGLSAGAHPGSAFSQLHGTFPTGKLSLTGNPVDVFEEEKKTE